MTDLWHSLAGNLAVVALFMSSWTHVRHRVMQQRPRLRATIFGMFMGGGSVASMLMSIELEPGVFIDLRSTLLAISGFFGGPYAALISTVAALVCRTLMGGAGVWSGAGGIMIATGIGLLGRFLMHGEQPSGKHILRLGFAVMAGTFISIFLLPTSAMWQALIKVEPAIAVLAFLSTTVSGLVILQARRLARERDLLISALAQAPDFSYVKNMKSEFAAVNEAVAKVNGFASPPDMIGKTDFDLTPSERAERLMAAEREILNTGKPLNNFEEFLADADGEGRWYLTSKVPLKNADGGVIGLAGVTRDITADKALRQEVMESRNQLSYALAEMSDGLAMYDKDGYLAFCNEQYRRSFPLTGAMRQPGVHMREILRAVVQTGEQNTAPKTFDEAWVETVMATLRSDGEEEINLFDGRWLYLRTRMTTEGASLVVVSDLTKIKQAEIALLSATAQLKLLANTDGLTGLLNRRAFDLALADDVARNTQGKASLSLLMIDVDRFKTFNDLYGHPAGDECLRIVSQCLRDVLKRQGEIAVRYGGEEFIAILPDTDENGAMVVARLFQEALRQRAVPHTGSEKGFVTASVGIATYRAGGVQGTPSTLISRADEALYEAKAVGRDAVIVWQPKANDGTTGAVRKRRA